MGKLIYNVRQIFGEYLTSEKAFYNIPEYQRGYKWTAANVIQLLEDLKNFKKSDNDQFYCLQNITITKQKFNDSEWMNVIDGQQRLTTLFILISHLQRNMKGYKLRILKNSGVARNLIARLQTRRNGYVMLTGRILTA